MLTFGLKPPPPGLSPKEYRDYIKYGLSAEIKRIGACNVLWHKDYVVFYSGPSKKIQKIIIKNTHIKNPSSNDCRSIIIAKEKNASRINDTQAAKFLGAQELDDYFTPVLSPKYPDPANLMKALDAAYAEVWGGISELFAEMSFQRAATAVCGAAQNRIFLKDEFPALIGNPHLETINDIDMQAVRDMFRDVGVGEAFNLLCLSELKMAYRHAETDLKSPITAWNDYFERLTLYETERGETQKTAAALSPSQERRKQEIMAKFNLASLYATSPRSWGGPIIPAPSLSLTVQKPTPH